MQDDYHHLWSEAVKSDLSILARRRCATLLREIVFNGQVERLPAHLTGI